MDGILKCDEVYNHVRPGEVFYVVINAMKGRQVLLCEPCYERHKNRCVPLAKCRYEERIRRRGEA